MTATRPRFTDADLEGLLAPAAVTIVGASEKAAPARHLMANLLAARTPFAGPVNLVNRSQPTLHGRIALADTTEVEGPPGLVFLLLDPRHCMAALRGLTELPQGVVVYSSGAESGHAEVERDLSDWSAETGVPLLGPQATGVVRPASGLVALTAPLRAAPVDGRLGLLMQSAGLLGGTINALWQREIGVHTAVSLGNSAVLGYADLAMHLVDNDDVRALAVYVDSLSSMDGLITLAAHAQSVDKPVVLCVGGSSDAGRAAVRSHTGGLATSRRVLCGVAEQYGVVLVNDTDELVWAVEAFDQMEYRRPGPGGVGIFSTSGGGAIMLADALTAGGALLPVPGAHTKASLNRNRNVASFNPFDVGAAALDDADAVSGALRTFAADPAFSVVVSVATVGIPTLEGMSAYVGQTTDFIATVVEAGKQPLIAAPVASAPNRIGVPVATWPGVPTALGSKEAAVKSRSICAWGARPDVSRQLTVRPVGRASDGGELVVVSGAAAEYALRELAVSWPTTRTIGSFAEAESALGELTFPVVAKVEAGLAHRAANGGVIRGLADPRIALLAIRFLLEQFSAPVAIAEQISFATELTLGFQTDPVNGPLLMFGRGGGDVGASVDFRRLPMSRGQMAAVIARYVEADTDRDALASALTSFQDYVLGHADIESLDLNPIVVVGGSVFALDAKIHTRKPNRFGM